MKGLDLFKTRLAAFADQYVLIGGAACTVAMQNVGIEFCATKDLDVVLCVEVLDAEFAKAFWQFVLDGDYEIREKASGGKQLYRFTKPKTEGFPFMLELFAWAPDVLTLAADSELTPIPFNDEASSLSVILLDEHYYQFLQEGKREVDGLQIVGPEHLIALKARTEFRENTWKSFQRTAIDGLNATEVAEELGMSPSAVRKARSRVTQRLEEALGGYIDSTAAR